MTELLLQALRADGDGGSEQEAQAANELERRFNKNDFRHMVIHGQFNKGFIMASCGRELFIIDQHASDEKFNFERLQDTLVLNKCAAPCKHVPSMFALNRRVDAHAWYCVVSAAVDCHQGIQSKRFRW